MRKGITVLHKIGKNSCLIEDLLASSDGPGSVDFSCLFIYLFICVAQSV